MGCVAWTSPNDDFNLANHLRCVQRLADSWSILVPEYRLFPKTHSTMAKTLTDIVHSQNGGQYDQTGFAGSQVAWTPDQSQTGFLLTTDGGAKWSNIQGVSNVDFVNGEDGWALSGGLLRTTNGGKTWTYASHPTP